MNNFLKYSGLIVFAAVFFGSTAALIYLNNSQSQKELISSKFTEEKYSEKEEFENPAARAEQEFMMQRNPTGKIPENIYAKEREFVKNIPSRNSYRLSKSTASKNYEWESIGPRNISGRTRALAVDVTNENILIAAGVSGGVFKSIDGGTSWYRVTDKTIRHSVTSIVQDTRQGMTNNWYYSSGERIANSARKSGAFYFGNGVYKSTDNGESWEVIPGTESDKNTSLNNNFQLTYRIKMDPSNTDNAEIYIAGNGVIIRSDDDLESWTYPIGESYYQKRSSYTDVDVTSTGVVYATFSSRSESNDYESPTAGIYRSEDGTNWSNITPSDFPYATNRIVMDIYDSDENIVYFLAETPGSGMMGHTIWRYEHAASGDTWQNRSEGIPHDSTNDIMQYDSQHSYNMVIGVNPQNENNVFIGGTSLFRSSDGFQTAENVTHIGGYADAEPLPLYPNHWVDQHVILFSNEDPNVMYVGNDGGIYKTDNSLADEVAWTPLVDNYITSQFYDIAIDEKTPGSEFIIGGLQDRGVWYTDGLNNTSNWAGIPIPGDGAYSEVGKGNYPLYFSFQNGRTYYKLSEGGAPRSLTNKSNVFLFVNPFAIDPNDDFRLYMASRWGILRNTIAVEDTSISYKFLGTSDSTKYITALDVSKEPANIVYYSNGGSIFRVDSADTENPSSVEITGIDMPNGYVTDIWIDSDNAENVMVSYSNYGIISIYYTSDGGATWSAVAGNLEEFPDGSGSGVSVRSVDALKFGSETIYFAGTSAGLYSTDNLNGPLTVWQLEGENSIGNVVVISLETRSSDGLVLAATHGSGIYKSTITTGVEDDAISRSFTLSQNYPNPFNPSTKINYHLSKSTKVELKIFDILGREVTTLVNEFMNIGDHSIEFSASNLASGTYIYRLKAGDYVKSRKMVLLK